MCLELTDTNVKRTFLVCVSIFCISEVVYMHPTSTVFTYFKHTHAFFHSANSLFTLNNLSLDTYCFLTKAQNKSKFNDTQDYCFVK